MGQTATQLVFDLPVRSAMGREDFLVAASNAAAVAWIDRWPDWPTPALLLCGPEASGKTHLALLWAERAKADVIARPSIEKCASDYARHPRPIVIDDADGAVGDRATEGALFHLYNMAREHKQTILIVLKSPPSQLAFRVPDLASRLRACPVATIEPPDDMLLSGVILKLFSDRQKAVSGDVITYLVPRMERSFEGARKLVAEIDKKALAQKKPITLALVRDVLEAIQTHPEAASL